MPGNPEKFTGGREIETVSENQETVLNPSDPIDSILIGFKKDISDDRLPTFAEQKSLLTDIRTGDPSAASSLVGQNRGTIAFVASQYKDKKRQPGQLLATSRNAFVRAAMTYRNNGESLENHVLPAMTELMDEYFGEDVTGRLPANEKPADYMIRAVEKMEVDTNPDTAVSQSTSVRQKNKARSEANRRNKLGALAARLGLEEVNRRQLGNFVNSAQPPSRDYLKEYYFSGPEVTWNIVADKHGITGKQAANIAQGGLMQLRQKHESGIGFRAEPTRSEQLALRLGIDNLEDINLDDIIGILPENQREVFTAYFLSGDDISERQVAERLGIGRTTVHSRLKSSLDKAYRTIHAEKIISEKPSKLDIFRSRTGLEEAGGEAVEAALVRASPSSRRVLEEFYFTSEDVTIEDVSKKLGYTVNGAKRLARRGIKEIRQVYSPGKDSRNILYRQGDKSVKFAAMLGLEASEEFDKDRLLSVLSEKSRQVVEAYYSSPDEVKWTDVAAEFGITASRARNISTLAFKKMRSAL